MQKFTEQEAERYHTINREVKQEVDDWYHVELEQGTAPLLAQQLDAGQRGDGEAVKEIGKRLSEVRRNLKHTAQREARQLLKERFDYPIFLYESDRVGITATGEPDKNELFPNDNQPEEIETTCLELYQEFRSSHPFFASHETDQ